MGIAPLDFVGEGSDTEVVATMLVRLTLVGVPVPLVGGYLQPFRIVSVCDGNEVKLHRLTTG